MRRECSIDGCSRPSRKRGWCEHHWGRWYRMGDPLAVAVSRPAARARIPAIERLLARIEILPNGCWEWTGAVDRGGYGKIVVPNGKRGGALEKAHRLALMLLIGPIPEGFEIDHTCHNTDPACAGGPTCRHRRCVCPDHLEAVPKAVNGERGKSFAANNARLTHCVNGHEFTDENTRRRKGRRFCRACEAERTRRYMARKKELAA